MNLNVSYSHFNILARKSGYIGNAARSGLITKKYKKWFIDNKGKKPIWNKDIIFNPVTQRVVKKSSLMWVKSKKPRIKKKFEKIFDIKNNLIINKAAGITGDHKFLTKKKDFFNYREFENPFPPNLPIWMEDGKPIIFAILGQTKYNIINAYELLLMEAKMIKDSQSISNFQGIQILLTQREWVFTDQNILRTTFLFTFEAALKDILKRLQTLLEKYDGDYELPDTISFRWVINAPLGGQGTKNLSKKIKYTDMWYIYDTFSITNCLWRSLYICKNQHNKTIFAPKTITQGARLMRKRANFETKKFSTIDEIQKYVDFISNSKKDGIKIIGVHLYNNLYEKIETFTPINNKTIDVYYEIQLYDNHYKPLLRWENIPFEKKILIKKHNEEQNQQKNIIIPTKKGLWKKEDGKFIKNIPQKDTNIACWDIEATQNETKDGNFKAYMVGLAWYEYYDEISPRCNLRYEKFQGLDCLLQFCKFLSDNSEMFNSFTFYAHNGGNFDIPLLFREALFDFKDLEICSEQFIELNGAYINVIVKKDEHKFTFKDSIKLLPVGLEKLCEDFKVTHQKLTESVTFDEININNWHTIKQLPKYLEHDCKGLLEVMTTFSDSVYSEMNINIQMCYTGATLAKQHFFTNYYNSKYDPIYTLSEKYDKYCRRGYFGGRVEC